MHSSCHGDFTESKAGRPPHPWCSTAAERPVMMQLPDEGSQAPGILKCRKTRVLKLLKLLEN